MKNKIIIAGIGILFFSCTNSKSEVKEPVAEVKVTENEVVLTPEQIKNAGITIGTPEQRSVHRTLKLKGVIDVPPQNSVAVTVPLGGYLKQMSLIPGMSVGKGAVLARVEDQQYIQLQQDYLVGKARLQFLEEDYNRQKELNESKAVSDKVYQQVRSEYQSQRAILRALEEKLRLIGINPSALSDRNISRSIPVVAPISGSVSKVNVNPGQYVSPTDRLFEIVNASDKHLSLTVFENDVTDLAIGQRVLCYTNGNAVTKYVAKISLINRHVDDERASEIHCHFETEDNKLVPGMFMNAEVELGNTLVTAIPDDAIVRWENQNYIFTADAGNKFTMLPVETGDSKDGYTAIKTNLDKKKIVTAKAYTLLMKLKNSGEE